MPRSIGPSIWAGTGWKWPSPARAPRLEARERARLKTSRAASKPRNDVGTPAAMTAAGGRTIAPPLQAIFLNPPDLLYAVTGSGGVVKNAPQPGAPSFRSFQVMESISASKEASMMLGETPTVVQRSPVSSVLSIKTRVMASVPPLRMRTR